MTWATFLSTKCLLWCGMKQHTLDEYSNECKHRQRSKVKVHQTKDYNGPSTAGHSLYSNVILSFLCGPCAPGTAPNVHPPMNTKSALRKEIVD